MERLAPAIRRQREKQSAKPLPSHWTRLAKVAIHNSSTNSGAGSLRLAELRSAPPDRLSSAPVEFSAKPTAARVCGVFVNSLLRWNSIFSEVCRAASHRRREFAAFSLAVSKRQFVANRLRVTPDNRILFFATATTPASFWPRERPIRSPERPERKIGGMLTAKLCRQLFRVDPLSNTHNVYYVKLKKKLNRLRRLFQSFKISLPESLFSKLESRINQMPA